MCPRSLACVTLAARRAVAATPKEFPSWAIVLNIPPARACSPGGKLDVTTRLATLKSKSAPTGAKHMAKNSAAQYNNLGFNVAKIRGDIALSAHPTMRMPAAGTFSTRAAATTLVRMLKNTSGRKRRDVDIADMPWMSCRRRVLQYEKALNAAHITKTVMQMLVNSTLRHMEFGMTAGRPRRS